MCPLRIILLLRFATCLVQIPASSVYCPPTIMTDTDEANSSARASNYNKDRLGAEPLTALSRINLNNRKVAAQYYEDTRTAMMRHLQMADGLFDLAADFAQKTGDGVPWGADKKAKLKVHNNMGNKVGSARTLPAVIYTRRTQRASVQR